MTDQFSELFASAEGGDLNRTLGDALMNET